MDINIEAISHPNQAKLLSFYEKKLRKRYGKYEFLKAVLARIKSLGKDGYEVSISMQPVKGRVLFAKSSHRSENSALTETIKKLDTQLHRYRVHRYQRKGRAKKVESLE